MLTIGILGRAGAGKDPASLIVAAYAPRFTVIMPLATGLKQMLAAYYGWSFNDPRLHTSSGKRSMSSKPLNPANPTVRGDMQALGDATRAIRPDIWVRDAQHRATELQAQIIVLPDVRRRNEYEHCDRAFWIGPDDAGDHATEAELTSACVRPGHRFMQPTIHERLHALRRYMSSELITGFWDESR